MLSIVPSHIKGRIGSDVNEADNTTCDGSLNASTRDGLRNAQIAGKTLFVGVSVKVFSEEISI